MNIDFNLPSIVLVISGPSGVGKGTISKALLSKEENLVFSISVTTRTPRQGEEDGVDYFFVNEEEFKDKIKKGEFLEWACVYGNYYGTPSFFIEQTLKKGYDVLLDIDMEGARQIKDKLKDSVTIFLLPPSWEELRNRLLKRGTENIETINYRFKQVKEEMKSFTNFGYWVVNDEIEKVVSIISSILHAEKRRIRRLPGDSIDVIVEK